MKKWSVYARALENSITRNAHDQRQRKSVLKNWRRVGSLDAYVRLPPLGTSAQGPRILLEAELSANQPSAVQRGDPGEVCWRCNNNPHTQLLTCCSQAHVLCCSYTPASMWPKQKALLPYMVCSAIALIHNAFPNPPSLALHKLSRADVQLLSSNFAWLKKKSMIARFTKCFFPLLQYNYSYNKNIAEHSSACKN